MGRNEWPMVRVIEVESGGKRKVKDSARQNGNYGLPYF